MLQSATTRSLLETYSYFAIRGPEAYTGSMQGVVQSLHRHPIKSLLGEEVREAELGERGLAGDRAFAFVDALTGKIASAKQPRHWSALLTLCARYRDQADLTDPREVEVMLPDGRSLHAGDPGLAEAVAQLVGRAVQLVSAPPPGATIERLTPEGEVDAGKVVEIPVAGGAPAGTLFDFAPLHFVSTASLRALAAHHPARTPSVAARFRPNVVIALDEGEGFIESQWMGRELALGEARLQVICATPRCAVPCLAHGPHVPRDPQLVRTLGQHNRVPIPGFGEPACLGAYARVITPGRVRLGDAVRLA